MNDADLDLYLEDQLTRVRLMTQRWLRRRADRVVGQGERYGDDHVGRSELRRLLLIEDERGGQAWLDALGLPPRSAIEATLALQDEALAARLARWPAETPPPPLEVMRERFGLDKVAFDLLLVTLAPRISPDIARLYSVAWADFSIKQPDAHFLCGLVCPHHRVLNEAMAALSPDAPLRRSRLVVLHAQARWTPSTPRLFQAVAVPERVIDVALWRSDSPPATLAATLHREGEPLERLSFSDDVVETTQALLRRDKPRMTLVGEPGCGRLSLLRALARPPWRGVLEVSVVEGLDPEGDPVVWMAEVLREARLQGASLLLRLEGLDAHAAMPDPGQMRALRAMIAEAPLPVAFTVALRQSGARAWTMDAPEITLKTLPQAVQRALWERALYEHGQATEAVGALSGAMARRYQLTPGAIKRAVWRALDSASAQRPTLSVEALEAAVRTRIVHGLGDLARLLLTRRTLQDVVLPEDRRGQLDEILRYARHADQVYNRWGFADSGARGLSVLFSGPPGTGKTMVASILARELGRVLYQIDLSRVVDKYIGETEKNLARIFDEAEKAQAVLLFDEADSLFAGRTEVRSSNDRYANLEVNFLLQRLEEYSGVSILTTNAPQGIDEAFQRRIRFKIDFPKPDAELRAQLWQRHVPEHARDSAPIDWAVLGEAFELTGGHIRNAALRAAFQAADAGSGITEDMLFDAAYAEARELGLLVPHY